MNQATLSMPDRSATARNSATSRDPTYQAYQILRLGFVVAPILAGADKCFHVLVNWDQYLAPEVTRRFAKPQNRLLGLIAENRLAWLDRR